MKHSYETRSTAHSSRTHNKTPYRHIESNGGYKVIYLYFMLTQHVARRHTSTFALFLRSFGGEMCIYTYICVYIFANASPSFRALTKIKGEAFATPRSHVLFYRLNLNNRISRRILRGPMKTELQ